MGFLGLKTEAFGLDINDTSLKIMKLGKRRGFLQPVSFGESKLEPGIIKNGVIINEDGLTKNIKKLLLKTQGEKLNTRYVIASLPEEKVFSQVIQMPKMKEEELKSAVALEAENYIPLPAGDVYLDFQTIRPTHGNTDHLDVFLGAAEKVIVDSYVSCLKKSGLVPCAMESETQAIARALVKGEFCAEPVAIVDFGGDNTNFIVFSGNSVRFTSSIPFSSQQVTEAISSELDVDFKKAEEMKIKYGLSSQIKSNRAKTVSKVMDTVIASLIAQIKKYADFYSDHDFHEHSFEKKGIKEIILSGGGVNLRGLDRLISKELGIPVILGDPWVNFSEKIKKFNLPDIQKKQLAFVTATGLALRGIKNYD